MTYLDHAATTPLRPVVAQAMTDARARHANPASTHRPGQAASALLEDARERIAAVVGVAPSEVVFTSGGTESVNLALQGIARVRPGRLLVSAAEHHATLETAQALQDAGRDLTVVPVDVDARLDLDALEQGLQAEQIALVSTIWANNEIGTIEHLAPIVALTSAAGVPLHVDAVAALGHVPVRLDVLGGLGARGLTAVSVAAHKLGGPLGIGALFVARDAPITALQFGGGHERKLRAGTVDAVAAHGFAVAAETATAELEHEAQRLGALRDRLHAAFRDAGGVVRGDPIDRVPGTAHATFDGVVGEALQFALDVQGFAVSTGSACSAGVVEPSHVLTAIGLDRDGATSAIRVTLGWSTTEAEIDAFVAALPEAVDRARRGSR